MKLNILKCLTANKLKILAITLMFFDHFVSVFMPSGTVLKMMLRIPGRIVAPIICFLIAEGYFHTSNRKKYIIRLLIFAVISHVPFIICFNYTSFFQTTSIIYTLAIGLIALTIAKNEKIHIVLKIIAVILCCVVTSNANWGYTAVLWIVFFGMFRGNLKLQIISFVIIGLLTYVDFGFFEPYYLSWHKFGIFLAIPFILMYNGKLGKKSEIIKWSFYIFYPLHLVVLYYLTHHTTMSQFFIHYM